MGNDNQFVELPIPAFVNPTTATTPTVTSKDGIIAFQTPVEPMESRQTLLNEQKISTKTRSPATSFSLSAEKIFALALLVLLIILIAYILFHGKQMDNKLNRLDEINRRVQAIEYLLAEQSKKANVNLQLTGQDIREFYSNQTVLKEFLRRLRERRWTSFFSSLCIPASIESCQTRVCVLSFCSWNMVEFEWKIIANAWRS